jgi:hypothetical protein
VTLESLVLDCSAGFLSPEGSLFLSISKSRSKSQVAFDLLQRTELLCALRFFAFFTDVTFAHVMPNLHCD